MILFGNPSSLRCYQFSNSDARSIHPCMAAVASCRSTAPQQPTYTKWAWKYVWMACLKYQLLPGAGACGFACHDSGPPKCLLLNTTKARFLPLVHGLCDILST